MFTFQNKNTKFKFNTKFVGSCFMKHPGVIYIVTIKYNQKVHYTLLHT